ncbi:hypothetical protein FOA52_001346 [Chlamydomonas sp. UWO 241]|nr:hypothetical protein FOA52_001346 [Chlamydomonas sp. UWO 241]
MSPFWLSLNCLVFVVKLAGGLYTGWDLQAVVQIVYTSIFLAHWLVALCSRRSSSSSNSGANSSKLAAVLRWLFVDHVCAVLHISRNVLLLTLTTFNANISWSGPLDGMIVTSGYAALAAFFETYDLTTSLVVNWAVLLPRTVIQVALLSRREELSLTMTVFFPMLHACAMSAIHMVATRYSPRMQQRRAAAVQTPWAALTCVHSDAPADHNAGASEGSDTGTPLLSTPAATAAPQAPAPANSPAPAVAATWATPGPGSARPADDSAQAAVGGGGLPIYRSVLAGDASAVEFVTKFPSLHLSQHPQLSTPQGVAALQERLECRASEVLSRMRGERVEVRLTQLYVAAGCVVVAGRWHLQGAGGASEQEQRALVEEVLLEEMLQEVDPAPEGMRTPCCILDNNVLDSTSDMWQLGSTDDDEVQPEQATLHIETGRRTPVTLPSMAGVPLLAATTPLQALLPHDGGHSRVHMQFATPLLARALGRDPELVVSFALAGVAGAPAPLASMLRARVGDLQAAARARGNPPGLMDVDIDLGSALAGAAREYGGILIAQLVDGPTMLAAVPVSLLPCTARPAVAELSRLGLDLCAASHIARDLGLLLLAPHPTGEPPHARRAMMRDAAQLLTQWARHAHHHLPATLALLESAVVQMDAEDACPPPPPRMSGACPAATAAQGAAGSASTADREGDGSASAVPHTPQACEVAHTGPTTLWCKFNMFGILASVARSAFSDGLGLVFLGNATSCFLFALPYIAILTARAYPAVLARLPRCLRRVDVSLLRRVYHLVLGVVVTQALGYVQPGFCNLGWTGMDIPFMCMLDFVEPLQVRAWWVRAATVVVLLVPPRVLVMCACSGQVGAEALCTREAWGTFTSEVGLVAFLAPRVAMPFVANGAICLCRWMSARARSGGKSKQE